MNLWWGFERLWEIFQVGILPNHHSKEPGAYSDNFPGWTFLKFQGTEPGEKEPSVLATWSISPNEVGYTREQWPNYFEILLFFWKSQWYVGNSSQFLSTPVSGAQSISRKKKNKKDKLQDQIIVILGSAHLSLCLAHHISHGCHSFSSHIQSHPLPPTCAWGPPMSFVDSPVSPVFFFFFFFLSYSSFFLFSEV